MYNSCAFIGNLGKDPDVRSMNNGDKVVNLSIGCSERWKDKNGQKQERTTWVPVVIFGPLANIAEQYLRKGSKVFVQGKFSVRKWQDQQGNDRYSTEVVLQGPQAVLTMLDGAPQGQSGNRTADGSQGAPAQSGGGWDDDDSDIPFITSNSIY